MKKKKKKAGNGWTKKLLITIGQNKLTPIKKCIILGLFERVFLDRSWGKHSSSPQRASSAVSLFCRSLERGSGCRCHLSL